MEPTDRRYLELLASMESRRVRDRGQSTAGAFFRRDHAGPIERTVSSCRPARVPARRAGGQAAASPLRRYDPEFIWRRASAPQRAKEILLVEPDVKEVGAVEAALRLVADVEVCTEFRDARERLLTQPPDLLISNLRLQAYNGLHLVHLAAATHTRCIVYSTHDDFGLGREAQAAGAFFELPVRLPQVLHSYVNATLPHHDRRDITKLGLLPFRGGRRCTDR